LRREEIASVDTSAHLVGTWIAGTWTGVNTLIATQLSATTAIVDPTPPLAPGAPMSPERMALIEAFNKQSEGLETKYEARTHKADFTMTYRLFRPATVAKAPLVLYLRDSGGLGDDNQKQLGL